jgi:hypothetical protein
VAGKATFKTKVITVIPVMLPAIIDVVSGDGDGIGDGYDDSRELMMESVTVMMISATEIVG